MVLIEMFDLQERPMGLNLLKQLRQVQDGRHAMLPIAMTCSRVTPLQVHAARDAGASEFIAKPFSVESLFRSLARSDGDPAPPDPRLLPGLRGGGPSSPISPANNIAAKMRSLVLSGSGKTAPQLIQRAQARLVLMRDGYESQTAETATQITASLPLLQAATEEERPLVLGEIRRHAIRVREESLLHDYMLVDAVAASLCTWCDEHGGHPRLARAVRAHAAALQTVINGKMRGERPAERAALLGALTAELEK
jgi:CheY-like chemotaxis protein